ncbi:hypothetical protein [Streptomyces sp. NPDC058330]|uniref:hypothetical protein n=1 Tax=Streptomyces sp. NPDC058330 TaxID=3346449 RepID=UPI0036E26249
MADGKALPGLDRLASAVHDEMEDLQALVPTAPAPERSDRCGGNRDTGATEAVDAAQ